MLERFRIGYGKSFIEKDGKFVRYLDE